MLLKEVASCQEPLTKMSKELKSQTQGHRHNTKISICRISSLPNSTPWLGLQVERLCPKIEGPLRKKPSRNCPGAGPRSLLYCLRCLRGKPS